MASFFYCLVSNWSLGMIHTKNDNEVSQNYLQTPLSAHGHGVH